MAGQKGNLDRVVGALSQAGRVLTGRQIAGRGVTVYPDDVFLVSYPRFRQYLDPVSGGEFDFAE